MGKNSVHHDKKGYYCVECSNEAYKKLIPLLEHDPKKRPRDPHEFRQRCPRCGTSSHYHESEILVSTVRRVQGFEPAEGFRNVSA